MPALTTESAYALWAAHYPACAHNVLMEVEQSAVLALVPPVEGLTVLDAGCGTGRYLRLLGERGARATYGVDRSAAMLEQVNGATVVRADLAALPFAGASVDLVVAGLALNDVDDLQAAFREVARVLRPGGFVVYSTLHPRGKALGWVRTFAAAGQTWTLPVHWHSLRAYEGACRAAGLAIERRLEPALAGGQGPVALAVRASRL